MTTYFAIGWMASTVFRYREFFGAGFWQNMRSFDSGWVAAGPVLQSVRGCLFGLVLWPLRELWLDRHDGWLRVWFLFVGLAIIGPTAAAPGSLEGIVYTKLSLSDHLLGLPEVMTQTLLYCWTLQKWYRHPSRWWSPIMVIGTVLVCCLSLLGVLAALYPDAFAR